MRASGVNWTKTRDRATGRAKNFVERAFFFREEKRRNQRGNSFDFQQGGSEKIRCCGRLFNYMLVCSNTKGKLTGDRRCMQRFRLNRSPAQNSIDLSDQLSAIRELFYTNLFFLLSRDTVSSCNSRNIFGRRFSRTFAKQRSNEYSAPWILRRRVPRFRRLKPAKLKPSRVRRVVFPSDREIISAVIHSDFWNYWSEG